jgi:hypothetical protein
LCFLAFWHSMLVGKGYEKFVGRLRGKKTLKTNFYSYPQNNSMPRIY